MSIPGSFSSGVMTARLKAVGNRPDDNDAFINDVTNGASRSLRAAITFCQACSYPATLKRAATNFTAW